MENTICVNRTCCFFGHRKIDVTPGLKKVLCYIVEGMILTDKVDTFLFGSKSEFDSLCLDVVTCLKEKYPQIRRIYVRAEFEHIEDDYVDYLLDIYDGTYLPKRVEGAGRTSYVQRNREMIDKSKFCIAYYKGSYVLPKGKSGTKIAYEYAMRKKKKIVNLALRSVEIVENENYLMLCETHNPSSKR
ncbi:MAG: hypothetical protein IJ365_08825 [Clostridia bacterium]|nr:hypothetical protein [Clostridia bacterium]